MLKSPQLMYDQSFLVISFSEVSLNWHPQSSQVYTFWSFSIISMAIQFHTFLPALQELDLSQSGLGSQSDLR